MLKIINSIELSLKNENWHSALMLSLIIPDICGKIENSNEHSSKRYPKWFDLYLGKKYKDFLSGKDCYALRCSFLHEGSNNIEKQRSQDALDYFVFTSNGAHCTKFSSCNFGKSKYNGKEILQISVSKFCQDIIEATKKWIDKQKNISELLKIHEDGLPINDTIKFL